MPYLPESKLPDEDMGLPTTAVFSGPGLFTAWDPLKARGLNVEWVAMREYWWSEQADLLRRNGKRVVVWEAIVEDAPLRGQAAVDRLGAVGWIGQDENTLDRQAALAVVPGLKVPWALVTNNHAPHDGRHVIVEAYTNESPVTSIDVIGDARRLGGVVVSCLFGTYDGAAVRPTLAQYQAMLPASGYPAQNWSAYLAETLSENDRKLLT